MPPFERPQMSREQKRLWIRTASGKDFREPEVLDDLWARFNTISIPILDGEAFLADALLAATNAENLDDLELRIARKSEDRRKELMRITIQIGYAVDTEENKLKSPTGREVLFKLSQEGSLGAFLQFVSGSVFGWEGEANDEPAQIKAAHSDEHCDDSSCSHFDPNDPDFWSQPDSELAGGKLMTPDRSPSSPLTSVHSGAGTGTVAAITAADHERPPDVTSSGGKPDELVTSPASQPLPLAETISTASLQQDQIANTVSGHEEPPAALPPSPSTPDTEAGEELPTTEDIGGGRSWEKQEERRTRSGGAAKRPPPGDSDVEDGAYSEGDCRRKRRATGRGVDSQTMRQPASAPATPFLASLHGDGDIGGYYEDNAGGSHQDIAGGRDRRRRRIST